jgi:predicted porin
LVQYHCLRLAELCWLLCSVAAYVADENKTRDGANNTAGDLRTTGYDVGAKWEGAGFMAGIAYNWFQVGDIAGTAADNVRLGGSYKGAWGGVNLMWEETKASRAIRLMTTSNKNGVLAVRSTSARLPSLVSTTKLFESNRTNANDGAFLAEVGAVYNLSKRSSLKAVYAYLDNESNATLTSVSMLLVLPAPVQPCKVCNLACVTTSNLA